MHNDSNGHDYRTLLQRAYMELEKSQKKLKEHQQAQAEPLAIIGMGCRFPGGVNSPADYWHLLREGLDAVTEVPAERWQADVIYDPDPDAPGKTYARWGGFLDQIDHFDPGFFGISPREAVAMDPQQRLLLEVAWEALEDAGLPVERLAGSRTGVFVGIYRSEYGALRAGDSSNLDVYSSTGTFAHAAAGRLSFLWDLQGPSLAVDTACSSSLVALHLACQSLRHRESDLALAGGVKLILSPALTMVLSRMHGLARDGRCKTFDARADGFVSSEGCGMLILKRFSDAQRDGDRVLALIRGSAINQDGRSASLTAPSGTAQQAVIRQALSSAHVSSNQISYVEAHGTGTSLGDPIELDALAAVIGSLRPDGRTCAVGSSKTNLGHLESAAGVAGVMKVVLAMQHGEIPANLHFQTLNPIISLERTCLTIPTTRQAWEGPRLAGVSSFGVSGTNAHIIMEEAPAPAGSAATALPDDGRAHLLPISAKSPQAARELAQRYAAFLREPDAPPLHAVCATASLRRSHHPYRLAVVGGTHDEMAAALDAATTVALAPTMQAPQIVFVFPGQGSQWVGMGQQLIQTEPVFREMIERCEAAFAPHVPWSLTAVLQSDNLGGIDTIQPVIFAVQVALAALWQSWGIEPAAVVGHSMGEAAAAYVAGALSLEDAARVICRRSTLLHRISGQGAMTVVELSWDEAQQAIAADTDQLAVAVSNSRRSTVLSGDPAALDAVLARLEARGVFCRRVKVDVASHSPQVDALCDDLRDELAALNPLSLHVPMISSVTAEPIGEVSLDASYWVRNLRAPVRFADAVEWLIDEGHTHFLEVSPHPVLVPAMEEGLVATGAVGVVVGSCYRGQDERATLLSSLGALYVAGHTPAWDALHPERGVVVALPSYPWQRKRYWLEHGLLPLHTHNGNGAMAPSEPFHDWLYRVGWQPHDLAPPPFSLPTGGRWLIFADGQGVAQQINSHLAQQGIAPLLVCHSGQNGSAPRGAVVLDPTDPAAFRTLLAECSRDGVPVRGIIHLWSLDTPPAARLTRETLDAAQQTGCISVLHLLQAVAQMEGQEPPRLVLVTRGAQAATHADHAEGVAQSPLWGMGRVIQNEHPELACTLVDIDDDAASVAALVREATRSTEADEVALRGGTRYVARLEHSPLPPQPAAPLSIRADATYLVTGGLGGIGLVVATWLVEQGARHLVLLGRSGITSEETARVVDTLRAAGTQVHIAQADAANMEQMQAVFDHIARELPPLRGIIHSAGVTDNDILVRENQERFARVMAPKVMGAWNLHVLTQALPLDFMVFFSSVASLVAIFGHGNYATANAFLDGMAHYRRRLGLPALCINWGLWENLGMARTFSSEWRHHLSHHGFAGMTQAQGLAGLGRLLAADTSTRSPSQAQVCLAPMNWQQMEQAFHHRAIQPLLLPLVQHTQTQASPAETMETPVMLHAQLQALPPRQRLPQLISVLREQLARILHCEAEEIAPAAPLTTMGMDSLMALEFRNCLERETELKLAATLIWAYPTIDAIADHLVERLGLAAEQDNTNILFIETHTAYTPSRTTVEALEQMSEDEAEQRLLAKLSA